MSCLAKSIGGKFNFRVKIVQTDLAFHEYLFGEGISDGFFGGESPIVYQNSDYISKLYYINNYSGGILAKDKTEDIPEKYRQFMNTDSPTPAELIKNFKKEIVMLANREEVGHNVFYSSLSGSVTPADNPESDELKESGGFLTFDSFDDFAQSLLNGENVFPDGYENDEDDEDYEDKDGGENGYEEDYGDDEEIRNILNLNTAFNSDMYKMSKVEYDFSASGEISVTDSGLLNIKYDESEITGYDSSYIQLLFDPENRDILTIRRKHFFDDCVTLEKGRRISAEKRGRYSGAVATTSTKELVNNMTLDGGDMRIVYLTETDGVPTEAFFYSIYAEAAGS